MTDDKQTLGDALGPGVTTDDLAETERVLKRFEAVADDEFDSDVQWLTTAHSAVCRALEHYDSELGQDSTDTTPPNLNDAQWVREGLLDHPPDDPGGYTSSGAYALRKAHSADELVLYRAIDVIQTND